LAFNPVLGVAIVVSGVALGAAGGSAIESSQQTLSCPPVIGVAMSCTAEGVAAAASRAGRFGVGFRGLSLDEARERGLGERGAVLITDVAAGGAAETAGLRSGDLVLGVNGQETIDAAQLELAVLALAPGSPLALKVRRRDLVIEMALLPAGVAQRARSASWAAIGSSWRRRSCWPDVP
jgi:S1-C subfamily serine protease